MMYQPDANPLAQSDSLLKQGLALADELDLMMEAETSPHSGSSGLEDPSRLFEESIEEDTLLQTNVDPPSRMASSPQGSDYVESGLSSAVALAESQNPWAQVWLQRGFSKLNQNNFQGALDNFEVALQKKPHWSLALNGLGLAHYRLANFPEAVQAFRQAIDQDSAAAGLYCNLGAAYYLLGDFLNSVSIYQKAARLAPKEAHPYYGLGVSLMRQNHYSKALTAFRRAVALDDHHADSYYGMGYVSYQMGEIPAAIAALGKAKQRNSQYAHRYETFLKHCLQQDGSAQQKRS
jgi:tetratricopeptide (TPR) repeat protein